MEDDRQRDEPCHYTYESDRKQLDGVQVPVGGAKAAFGPHPYQPAELGEPVSFLVCGT